MLLRYSYPTNRLPVQRMPTANESPCQIPDDDPLFQHYHDKEWGLPVTSDRGLFEKVCLEGFQSGLSWQIILHKRKAFRLAFDNFNIEKVAGYDEKRIEVLLANPEIVRNRRKIISAINNAERAKALQAEFGSLKTFFWQFQPAGGRRPKKITRAWLKKNPICDESIAMAKALKQRGWTFVGPTTLYALMQATGIVNDHVHNCPVRQAVERKRHAAGLCSEMRSEI